ncbi:hypothetical protein OCH239_12890 [Roseivivax halodurans JCM 10272]|uniref:Uncharacterized protein n=1 Tax=Roseivivax halodurans JCM 10272 TaxID=1449350 RepID=X7EDK7_9RHOB|nr:hypothetical protein [Roseivivax halodurans]ETX13213.1 hypothetical protein OCH239_12890 [Roseivivax halodurans JCM 10272]
MSAAAAILALVRTWLWIGAGVAALFLTIGIGRIDANARNAFVFRTLLVPGILLIWPLVLWRWWCIERGSPWIARYRPPSAHGAAAVAMAILVLAALGLSLGARQDWPAGFEPRRLADAAP